ncbi:hypothetical protein [Nocardioides sp.]|uniref:hypothetical protein n=1 Tax=Nocardioides sp. TaxID=35761 RepID=UPI00378522AD
MSPSPGRRSWTLYPGHARVPDAAAPDVRARSYAIVATATLTRPEEGGVLLAHGDRHAGYVLRVADGRLVHEYAQDGRRSTVTSADVVPLGRPVRLEVHVRRTGGAGVVRLVVDGRDSGHGTISALARARTGYTGVDVGCDRGLTVGDYAAPARFTGRLDRVEVHAEDDQWLDLAAVWEIEGATQ